MARILALDVGEKTIGIAWSDETETLAFPDRTIIRRPGWRKDMAALRQIVQDQAIRRIVVGLPLMMNGTQGVQVQKISDFIGVLRRNVRIPIETSDERLTTAEAGRALAAMGTRTDHMKQTIDSIAACLLLQNYLDARRSRPHGEAD